MKTEMSYSFMEDEKCVVYVHYLFLKEFICITIGVKCFTSLFYNMLHVQ